MRQPAEMQRTIEYLTGSGQDRLAKASGLFRTAGDVILTGIGASLNAAMGAASLFHQAGHPARVQEAAELLHFSAIPRGAIIIAISRTGRSIEIVQLLAKARESAATVVGITNCGDSPLANESQVAIVAPAALDYAISVNTYSTLLLAASALASSVTTNFLSVANALVKSISEAQGYLELWQAQLRDSTWLATDTPYYFLARSGSVSSCQEARLLWEEGVKMPATAMGTSSFRHGPQEIVKPRMRFCMWIDQSQMREQDLTVAHDLRELGASVMLVGENFPGDAADLVCQLPSSPPHWQFVIDVLPVQLAAERLSRVAGVDCDSFRLCSYVVEDEHGLLRKVSKNAE